jgi:hypothetical protein
LAGERSYTDARGRGYRDFSRQRPHILDQMEQHSAGFLDFDHVGSSAVYALMAPMSATNGINAYAVNLTRYLAGKKKASNP